MNKSFETRELDGFQSDLEYLIFDEHWDGVRDDPRFKALLDKVGFTKVMPARQLSASDDTNGMMRLPNPARLQ